MAILLPVDDPDTVCPSCGSDLEWQECDELGCEDGWLDSDYLMEIDPLWYDEDSEERCESCGGRGGAWWCPVCQAFKTVERS